MDLLIEAERAGPPRGRPISDPDPADRLVAGVLRQSRPT